MAEVMVPYCAKRVKTSCLHLSSGRHFNNLSMKKPPVCLRKPLYTCPEMWPLVKATFFTRLRACKKCVTKISLAISFTCSSPINLHEIVIQISLCPTLLALTHSLMGAYFYFKVDRDLKVFPNRFAGSLKCLKRIRKWSLALTLWNICLGCGLGVRGIQS